VYRTSLGELSLGQLTRSGFATSVTGTGPVTSDSTLDTVTYHSASAPLEPVAQDIKLPPYALARLALCQAGRPRCYPMRRVPFPVCREPSWARRTEWENLAGRCQGVPSLAARLDLVRELSIENGALRFD